MSIYIYVGELNNKGLRRTLNYLINIVAIILSKKFD